MSLNLNSLIQRLLRLPPHEQEAVVGAMNRVIDIAEDDGSDDDPPPRKKRKPKRGRTMQTTVELVIRRN